MMMHPGGGIRRARDLSSSRSQLSVDEGPDGSCRTVFGNSPYEGEIDAKYCRVRVSLTFRSPVSMLDFEFTEHIKDRDPPVAA